MTNLYTWLDEDYGNNSIIMIPAYARIATFLGCKCSWEAIKGALENKYGDCATLNSHLSFDSQFRSDRGLTFEQRMYNFVLDYDGLNQNTASCLKWGYHVAKLLASEVKIMDLTGTSHPFNYQQILALGAKLGSDLVIGEAAKLGSKLGQAKQVREGYFIFCLMAMNGKDIDIETLIGNSNIPVSVSLRQARGSDLVSSRVVYALYYTGFEDMLIQFMFSGEVHDWQTQFELGKKYREHFLTQTIMAALRESSETTQKRDNLKESYKRGKKLLAERISPYLAFFSKKEDYAKIRDLSDAMGRYLLLGYHTDAIAQLRETFPDLSGRLDEFDRVIKYMTLISGFSCPFPNVLGAGLAASLHLMFDLYDDDVAD